MTPHFHRLAIADIRRETPEAVSIAFAVPPELGDAYRFAPGQNLTIKTELEGEELRRCYSICSGLDEGELRIAVKKQAGGRFSTYANDVLKAGQSLDIMTPTGNFTAALDPRAARVYLGIACGSGITPLLSLIKTVLAREPMSRFFLLYGNRTTQSIIFRQALEDLKDRFLDRLAVTHVLSREAQDVPALGGRVDADKIDLFLRGMVPAARIDHAFLCGPAEMLTTAEGALTRQGLAAERIHVERFTTGAGAAPAARTPSISDPRPARPIRAEVTAVLDGISHRFPVTGDETIIEAALAAGLELPYSCRGGMCCTCRAKLREGKVEVAVNYSLEPWELAAGYVLTCQSRPTTPTIALDYDQV
jgi:ring-1,2-phenylacetyl-CoA epoxidase subunit PaaE